MTEEPEIHQIEVVNYAGEAGSRILDIVTGTDIGLVAGWTGIGGGGGNCFFASVQAMKNLLSAGKASGFEIVTGVFAHLDSPPIVHGWLEKGSVVLNVSNLKARPLYTMPKRDYYRHNSTRIRIQRLGSARVKRMLSACEGDVRAATKRLLKPTFAIQQRMIVERIAAIPDDQIDTSDIPEMGEEWFAKARVRKMRGERDV